MAWFAATSLAALAIAAIVVRSYHRPIILQTARHRLYGTVISAGQVQCFVGTQSTLRYPTGPTTAPVSPDIVVIDWNDAAASGPLRGMVPPTLDRFRVAMSNWPPLTQTASVLVGGQIATPTPSSPGLMRKVYYREFGWELDARAVSAWLVLGLAAIPSVILAVRLWRTRHRDGHCRGCGYDLRSSSERCPECGRAAPVGGIAG